MARFIHCADIHLDSPLRRLETYDGAPVEDIRGASRRAFEQLVQLAISENVDFVIIAGDLYDGDWRDQQTGLFFASQVAKLRTAGIPIYVIRGNHDAASVITKSLPLPNNPDGSSVVLATNADSIRLESLGVSIHGQSFGTKAETENLVSGYPAFDKNMFNIGILHTSLSGAEGHDRYAPCKPTELVDKGYQYWALGHVHTRGEHQPAEAPCTIVFPGNIQGRNPRETGTKGCLLVDADSNTGETTRQFIPLDVVRWEICQIDTSTIESPDEMLNVFLDWAHQYATDYVQGTLVVRVRLVGNSELHDRWHREHDYFENALRSSAFEVVGPRVWIEGLRVRTEHPRTLDELELDGPLASIWDTFQHLEASTSDINQFDAGLAKELEALTNKLPSGLLDIDFKQLLPDARSSLLARLKAAFSSDAISQRGA